MGNGSVITIQFSNEINEVEYYSWYFANMPFGETYNIMPNGAGVLTNLGNGLPKPVKNNIPYNETNYTTSYLTGIFINNNFYAIGTKETSLMSYEFPGFELKYELTMPFEIRNIQKAGSNYIMFYHSRLKMTTGYFLAGDEFFAESTGKYEKIKPIRQNI